MSEEASFAAALRVELDAVVGRYEALVRAFGSAGTREADALRAEVARLKAERQGIVAELEARRTEVEALRGRVEGLEADLVKANAEREKLAADARAAIDTSLAYEEEFTVERAFVDAASDLGGSLLGEALASVVGRALEARSASYAALKARGVEATLVAATKERGRNIVTAPLLERERAAFSALAKVAGCESIVPVDGSRFAPASMDKASSVSDPAEEGNVVGCAMPGLRRAGTDGALVFPRVIVATG
jgi:hypothetical protein